MQFAFAIYVARLARNQIISEGSVFHVAWQCHDKKWLLKSERVKRLYYNLLIRYKNRYHMTFYGYHLMENHVHLIGRTETIESFSDFFRIVHGVFARQVNHRMHRRGQIVMERLKSPAIEDDVQMLVALTYIDLNGVRAGRDKKPEESLWSSCRYYAYGKEDDLLTPAPSYLALGLSDTQRQATYRNILEDMLMASKITI